VPIAIEIVIREIVSPFMTTTVVTHI
jgi:hypothetical protein